MNKLLQKLLRRLDFGRTNLDDLIAAGRTIALADVAEDEHLTVFGVTFRVGREFWATPGWSLADLEIEFELHTIRGGRLILDEDGLPASERALVRHGIRWTNFIIRY